MPSPRHLTLRLLLCLCATAFLPLDRAAAEPAFRVEKHRESFMSGGRKIGVEVFAPPGAGRLPAVLVLHTSAGTLLGKGALVDFSRHLAAQGHVAMLVRYFDRTGTIIANDDDIDRLPPVWVETIHDAVDWAVAHPRVRAGSIGFFGYSLGSYVAVAEASRDRRVGAVAEVAGGIFEGFRPRMQRMPPTLILHGRADQRVPVARAFELAKATRQLGPAPIVKIYDGEPHVLSRPAMADASARALAFLHERLSGTQARGR